MGSGQAVQRVCFYINRSGVIIMYEPATVAKIREWLEEDIKKGATHCLVNCDTWDLANGYEDYPLYIMPGENVHEVAR
ncbi:hypothetical protein SPSYN_01688 [Sporotomaculum syntrophicum]|uniref:Uncharacterized protein n=2 Tax=Sporotomaculum syntrophicum TaxID=182264 RepID=A0A9D2WQ64_9FIRM|nr:hypothetical protein SPSYN_01688 [Sporotomaculum syntrophicum]